jgi:hypothetical protein
MKLKKGEAVKKLFVVFMFIAAQFLCAGFTLDKTNKTSFDGETYYLAFSSKQPGQGFMNEYVREGETLKDWKKMVGVHHYPAISNPTEMANAMAKQINQLNKGTGGFKILVNKEKDEALIYFMISNQQQAVTEFNMFRYAKRKGGQGLIGYQFAFRNYGPTGENYKKEFDTKLTGWVQMMATSEIPALLEYFFNEKE